MAMRSDGRTDEQLREIKFEPGFQLHPAGSVLAQMGRTRVLCSVSVTSGVPRWMREQNVEGGWLTSEYQMLPGATECRTQRDAARIRPAGRNLEIQRLIGRSLRAAVDLKKVPAKTLYVDCDVIDADGGTRCASISGACVALEMAMQELFVAGKLREWPMKQRVAAVSVGIVRGRAMADLCYEEDAAAAVDMNVVMNAAGHYVEIQGTGEEAVFSDAEVSEMLRLAREGIQAIGEKQRETLEACS